MTKKIRKIKTNWSQRKYVFRNPDKVTSMKKSNYGRLKKKTENVEEDELDKGENKW